MKIKYILALFAIIGLCSCSSIKQTSSYAPVEAQVVSFTVADLDVYPTKIFRTTSWSYNPFKSVSVETIKTNTQAQMLEEAGADILVEPEYIVKKGGFLRGGSVTVIGFPAKFNNFHTMTPQEAEVFKAAKNLKKEKKSGKKFLFF